MFASVGRAFATLFDRRFLGLVFWSLVATAILFIALFAGIEYLLFHMPPIAGRPWINEFLELATPVILILAIFLIGAPVALLSTSPEREDTILMQNPFEA